mmetsp:Transcript_7404/g.16546  ORF Transcript_7404/g.16546 Transcript_7404/m.16546 type:complete len:322 (+) Transcript_7404:222-1187(+)
MQAPGPCKGRRSWSDATGAPRAQLSVLCSSVEVPARVSQQSRKRAGPRSAAHWAASVVHHAAGAFMSGRLRYRRTHSAPMDNLKGQLLADRFDGGPSHTPHLDHHYVCVLARNLEEGSRTARSWPERHRRRRHVLKKKGANARREGGDEQAGQRGAGICDRVESDAVESSGRAHRCELGWVKQGDALHMGGQGIGRICWRDAPGRREVKTFPNHLLPRLWCHCVSRRRSHHLRRVHRLRRLYLWWGGRRDAISRIDVCVQVLNEALRQYGGRVTEKSLDFRRQRDRKAAATGGAHQALRCGFCLPNLGTGIKVERRASCET